MLVILPERLFETDNPVPVISWLVDTGAPSKDKARALRNWAKWRGVKLRAADYAEVERSGTDFAQEIKLPGETK